jgi:hypothetical protein
MDVTYLFDESGEAVALLADGTVWSPSLRCVGSLALSNEPTFVIAPDGTYVGEVVGDRLCRRRDAPHVTDLGRRSEPMRPSVSWGTPPMGSRSMLPYGYEDVPRDRLA